MNLEVIHFDSFIIAEKLTLHYLQRINLHNVQWSLKESHQFNEIEIDLYHYQCSWNYLQLAVTRESFRLVCRWENTILKDFYTWKDSGNRSTHLFLYLNLFTLCCLRESKLYINELTEICYSFKTRKVKKNSNHN